MVHPDQASHRVQEDTDLPVLKHTLLTRDEIRRLLQRLGGTDVCIVLDNPVVGRFGHGTMGQILVTGPTASQLLKMADALVRNLRRRDLQECDVVGAQLGVEGNETSDNNDWLVVDCRNYVVHLQTPGMRSAVNLQALWTGDDPLYKLDSYDEDAVDEYVAKHPTPLEYDTDASSTLSFVQSFDSRLRALQKNRRKEAPRVVLPKKRKQKSRRR